MNKKAILDAALARLFRFLFRLRLRRSTKQINQYSTLPQRPATDDANAWHDYWKAKGQPWRTEPEIADKRQKELSIYCSINPDIERGIYPFKGIQLSRADVEWLLMMHENEVGSINRDEKHQQDYEGLDLRWADLGGVHLERIDFGKVHLDGANLIGAHLKEANLIGAYLQGTNLSEAHLEGANLYKAHLEEANLYKAHLEQTNLSNTHLEGAKLCSSFFDATTNIENATFGNERLGFVSLADVHWGDTNLTTIDWTKIDMLGDEREAQQSKQFSKYQVAVRANRQIAKALLDQGLNEEAVPFAYRAHRLKREVLKWRILLQPRQQLEHKWMLRLILRLRRKRSLTLILTLFLLTMFILLVRFQNVIPPLVPLGGLLLFILA